MVLIRPPSGLHQVQAGVDAVQLHQDAGDVLLLAEEVALHGVELLADADEFVAEGPLALLEVGHVGLHAAEDFQNEVFLFGHGLGSRNGGLAEYISPCAQPAVPPPPDLSFPPFAKGG